MKSREFYLLRAYGRERGLGTMWLKTLSLLVCVKWWGLPDTPLTEVDVTHLRVAERMVYSLIFLSTIWDTCAKGV